MDTSSTYSLIHLFTLFNSYIFHIGEGNTLNTTVCHHVQQHYRGGLAVEFGDEIGQHRTLGRPLEVFDVGYTQTGLLDHLHGWQSKTT